MKSRWIITILMILMMVSIATAIEECQGTITPSDVPCMIVTTWDYENACNTYQLSIYNSTPELLDTRALTDYTPTYFCNTTFNYTQQGSYNYNISNINETGTITVEADDEMNLAIVITLIGFGILSIIIGVWLYMSRREK